MAKSTKMFIIASLLHIAGISALVYGFFIKSYFQSVSSVQLMFADQSNIQGAYMVMYGAFAVSIAAIIGSIFIFYKASGSKSLSEKRRSA